MGFFNNLFGKKNEQGRNNSSDGDYYKIDPSYFQSRPTAKILMKMANEWMSETKVFCKNMDVKFPQDSQKTASEAINAAAGLFACHIVMKSITKLEVGGPLVMKRTIPEYNAAFCFGMLILLCVLSYLRDENVEILPELQISGLLEAFVPLTSNERSQVLERGMKMFHEIIDVKLPNVAEYKENVNRMTYYYLTTGGKMPPSDVKHEYDFYDVFSKLLGQLWHISPTGNSWSTLNT